MYEDCIPGKMLIKLATFAAAVYSATCAPVPTRPSPSWGTHTNTKKSSDVPISEARLVSWLRTKCTHPRQSIFSLTSKNVRVALKAHTDVTTPAASNEHRTVNRLVSRNRAGTPMSMTDIHGAIPSSARMPATIRPEARRTAPAKTLKAENTVIKPTNADSSTPSCAPAARQRVRTIPARQ